MSSEKTILPGFLVADLYRNNLVIIDDGAQPVEETIAAASGQTGKQWFLGSNVQKITLVVSEKEAAYLEDASLRFLTAILGACKYNLGDVAIVNYHKDPVQYSRIKEELAPRALILFGITTQQLQLPFTIPDYQVQSYDQCQFLVAPPLPAMLGESQEARLEKSKLWLCLKKMFSL
jgi:hypothetical protein